MSLKFIPVNFGFSKRHSHQGPTLLLTFSLFSKRHSYSGDTLIRDSRVEYSMVFAYKVIFCCVILLQTHIERTNSIQRYVEVLNTFAHKQYIIMRTKQHRRISLVVHLKMSGLILCTIRPRTPVCYHPLCTIHHAQHNVASTMFHFTCIMNHPTCLMTTQLLPNSTFQIFVCTFDKGKMPKLLSVL